MVEIFSQYWELLVALVSTGTLSSVLTMRIGVKSAKTDLADKVRETYDKLVSRLENKIDRLEAKSDAQEIKIEELYSKKCNRENCAQRI